MSTNRSPRLCAPDCRYRSLYEGSQASLSDMAAKQATALNRVARLRDGMIVTLKQTFPAMFAAAESQLGRRMSASDDEIVLAYLAGFLASRPAADLTPLRTVLTAAGVPAPPVDDVAAFAVAIRAALATSGTAPAPVAAPVTTPPHAAPAAAAPPHAAQRVTTAPTPAPAPAAGSHTKGRRPASAEDDLFGPPSETAMDVVDEGDLWDSIFEQDMPEDDAAPDGYLEDPLSGLFDDAPAGPAPAAGSPGPAPAAASPVPVAAPVEGPHPTEGPATVPGPAAGPATAPTAPVEAPAPQRSPLAPRRPLTPRPAADSGAAASTAPATGPVAAAEPGPGNNELTMRPVLFPSAAGRSAKPVAKRSRKAPRTAAARPDPASFDMPIVEGYSGEIGDDVYNQLVSAVCIPRPVFTSDLAAIVGSAEVVDAWQQRCQAERTSSPVRFIGAKQRHKARGDLVIPFAPELRSAASEFTSSWWAQCIDNGNMRGAKLYETAVLLHRFGEHVISNRIDDEATVLTLRLNQSRGLVGVVMLLEQRLGVGESARARLTESVEELLSGRLSLVAALTHTAGAPALEKLADTLREEAELRGWTRSTPMIAAHSWDYASDGGSSAVQVLG